MSEQDSLPYLRQSERSTFKRCPQRWSWAYLEGLVPATADRGARWFGTGIHLCFAEWYVPGVERGRPLAETWAQFTKDSHETIKAQAASDEEVATFEDAQALGFSLLERYQEAYGTDPHWEVVNPEQRFAVKIPDPSNPKKALATNVGTFDLVVRDLNDGHIKMVDHKTAGTILYRHLVLDDQAGSYIAMATHVLRRKGVLGPREAVNGMEYNFVRKGKADDRPRNAQGLALNKDGTISKRQPTENFKRFYVPRTPKERKNQIIRIGSEVKVMNAYREGKLPLIKNPTKDCPWDCDFFDLCEMDEAGGDIADYKRMAFRKQDPYHDHREGAANSKTSVAADKERKS